MTGLETTGVVVTAHYCVALIERLHAYYQRVQAGPERFRVQAESVNELIHTIELIKETESLDTPLVSRQLKTILDCLQKLDKLLKQALKDTESRKVDRFWKGLWTAKRGIQISDTFASLEEKKSSLSLCILQSAATSVDRIEKAITKQQPGQDHHIKEQWMEAGETPEDKSKIPRSMSDEITSSKSSVTTIDIDTEPVSQEKLVYAGKHRDSPVDMLRQEPPESGSLNSASGQLIKLPYARERMRQQPPDAAQPSNSGTPSSTHQGHCYKGKIIIVNAQNGNSLVGNVGLGGGSHVYENDISITSTTGEHNVQVGNIAQGCGPFSTK